MTTHTYTMTVTSDGPPVGLAQMLAGLLDNASWADPPWNFTDPRVTWCPPPAGHQVPEGEDTCSACGLVVCGDCGVTLVDLGDDSTDFAHPVPFCYLADNLGHAEIPRGHQPDLYQWATAATYAQAHPCTGQSTAGDACGDCLSCHHVAAILWGAR